MDKSIAIMVTNNCNLNCIHCYNRELNGNSYLSVSEIYRIIQESNRMGFETIILTGGEFFTHNNSWEIIDIIKKFPNILFKITTNASIPFTQYQLERLSQFPNLKMVISYDGFSEKVFNSIRGDGVKENVDCNINKLVLFNIPVMLKMTISRMNKTEVLDFIEFSRKSGLNWELSYVQAFGNALHNFDQVCLSSEEKLDLYMKIRNYYQTNMINKKAPPSVLGCRLSLSSEINTLIVKGDGDVCLCDNFPISCLGNIKNTSMNDLLNSKKVELLKGYLKKREQHILKNHCNDCFLVNVCKQGCPALSLKFNNDILSFDGECDFRRNIFLYDAINKRKEGIL